MSSMCGIDNSTCETLSKYNDEIQELETNANRTISKMSREYRKLMEPLFQEREAIILNVSQFWSSALTSSQCPLTKYMNSTVDPKLMRAVTKLSVITITHETNNRRKVILSLRNNIFCAEGEIFREIDEDGSTVNISPILWKRGTERARQDSLFQYFETQSAFDNNEIREITDSFDFVYGNPFLCLD